MQVLHEGVPIPDKWECPVGQEISGLSLRVLTGSGEEWDPAGKRFSVRSDWVRCQNTPSAARKKSKKGKKKGDAGNEDRGIGGGESLDLPAIQVIFDPF